MGLKLKYELKDFDKNKIVNKFNMEKGGKAELFLANNCFRRMHKYVPLETGTLASTVTVKSGSVTYEVPYAHKQYTSNKGKGNRGKYWDKRMVSAEKTMLVQELENYIRSNKK